VRNPLAVARSWFGFGARQAGGINITTAFGMDSRGGLHQLSDLDGTGFQRGLKLVERSGGLPIVSAINNLYANAFAQLRPHHQRMDLQTGRVENVITSAASRLMVQPNSYESFSTLLSRIAVEWLHGECLIWTELNARQEPTSLHLIPAGYWSPRIDPESREIFYMVTSDSELLFNPDLGAISTDDVISGRLMVLRSRDCMHLRWRTPRHPLIGESAFAAAGLSAGVSVALNKAQLAWVENMRRVSAVLSTDQTLTAAQMQQLRAAFDAQSANWAAGGIPVLASGVKMSSIDFSAIDASVIAALRFSNEEIARCAGVPPPLYGDLSSGTLTSSETLMRHWLSVSLGGLIERLERELERLFRMDGRNDYIELSTEALLRSDLATQASSYAQMLQGGILTPDEIRQQLGKGPAPGGDQLLVQRQMTPILLNTELAQAELLAKTAPKPEPVAVAAPTEVAESAPDVQKTIESLERLVVEQVNALRNEMISKSQPPVVQPLSADEEIEQAQDAMRLAIRRAMEKTT